jgi:hypothetical protein
MAVDPNGSPPHAPVFSTRRAWSYTHPVDEHEVDTSHNSSRVESVPSMGTPGSGLTRHAFFDRVVADVRREVAPGLNGFRAQSHGHLLKLHYENDRVHYEVWPDSHRGRIEVGLHFEDGPVSTAAYLRFFDARIVELKHLLGCDVELERWTVSWGHLYFLVPLAPFDLAKAKQTVGLLTSLIDVLEPLVRQASVPRERVDQPSERRRFYGRARS